LAQLNITRFRFACELPHFGYREYHGTGFAADLSRPGRLLSARPRASFTVKTKAALA
jgi:hypothetical protein